MSYSPIDLSQLPAPDVVETLDFEAILASMRDMVVQAWPEFADKMLLESEPVVKLLQIAAYRELLLRARVNDGARAVMLATATGADLENLAALFGVARLVITAADPAAFPPIEAVVETDTALRRRAQLALEGFSTAGPRGAYEFHALSADGRITHASVDSPVRGDVRITLVTSEGDGSAALDVIEAVALAVNADDVRPLTDAVEVRSAEILDYTVDATLTLRDGPDTSVVIDAAQAAVQAYVDSARRVAEPIRLSALYAALHQPGVRGVQLASPIADIEPSVVQAANCTAITIGAAS